jgi:predicted Fe-Mo cluster-binding NifX family protein
MAAGIAVELVWSIASGIPYAWFVAAGQQTRCEFQTVGDVVPRTCHREATLVKIAVPIFGSRVSPRFDCAQAFLLVTANEGNGLQRQQLAATNWAPHERIVRLMELGVKAVICGGIDAWSAESLRSAGIIVCNSITGDVDEALDALLRRGMFVHGCPPMNQRVPRSPSETRP